ncbi:MAG TPA: hypothetical protein VG268_01760 [Streptosporangiaceae bacterium]|nr:hypothetical protein [Streptosporangiaceae bacterium]
MLPVEVVEVQAGKPLGLRGDGHHPAGDVLQQQVGQGEVPQVVDACAEAVAATFAGWVDAAAVIARQAAARVLKLITRPRISPRDPRRQTENNPLIGTGT